MPKTVQISVQPPQSVQSPQGDARGFKYPAVFQVETGQRKKPAHRGPEVEVAILSEAGEILQRKSYTVVVQDKGEGEFDVHLNSIHRVLSSLEEGEK